MLIVLPLYHFLRKCLLWQAQGDKKKWYPAVAALSEMTLIIALFLMIIALIATGPATQISALVANSLKGQVSNPNPEVEHYIRLISGEWNFMIFVVGSWTWIGMLYAFTLLANRWLVGRKQALRESLALTLDGIPLMLLPLLLVTAMLAFFGTGNDKYAGQTLFLLFLFPYILAGFAGVHQFSRRLKNRELFLGVFYILIFGMPLLALLLAGWAFYRQIAQKL